ncbi:MAG TPA: hypothetical protein ENG83_13195 [Nitrospirae bacterium]|nr:hypothetical protein BMS3Abin06_01823 [bacterium BMS3Abin06]HDH13131.1 hypothetical protein [Nitrospirota bacterium]HDZ03313.1 hypothetical protein [Nitrospirota bacterium]
MSFWDKIQEDIKKNLQGGLDIFREGSSVVTEKLEKLTVEGRNKYKVFNLNMKVQEEFAKLGGEIYDLTTGKSKNPLGNRKVKSIISRINKLENQINKLESKEVKKPKKTAAKKTAGKSTKKTTGKTRVKSRAKTKSSAAATGKNKKS